MKKEQLDQLGTAADLLIRETSARRDDDARCKLIEDAISKIQTQGAALSGKTVEILLKPQSLQPVMVRRVTFPMVRHLTQVLRMHSQDGSDLLNSIFFRH